MELQKRYLEYSDFNRTRIIQVVEKLLEKKGAVILRGKDEVPYVIIRRSDRDELPEEERPHCIKWGLSKNYCHSGDVLHFVYKNYYYSLDFDDNPFFPIHYCKIAVDGNYCFKGKYYHDSSEDSYKTNPDHYLTIAYDDLFKNIPDEDIIQYAEDFIDRMFDNIQLSELYADANKTYCLLDSYNIKTVNGVYGDGPDDYKAVIKAYQKL